MMRPAIIECREFTKRLQELLNDSNLPAFVIIPVVRNALLQLEAIDENEYKNAVNEWEKAVNENGEQTDKSV